MIVQTRTTSGSAARPNVAVTAKNVTDTGCPTQVTYSLGTTDASGQPHRRAAVRQLDRRRDRNDQHRDEAAESARPGDPDGDGLMVTPRGLMILRRRVSGSSERGITLVELIVTVSLMTVVLGFVTRGFIGLQNASAGASLRLQNLEEARTLMNAVSKDLRTAARLSSTTSPFDVTLPTTGRRRSAGGAPPVAPLRARRPGSRTRRCGSTPT